MRAKHIVEKVLRLAIGRPRRMAGHALILGYHNVVPDAESGHGDVSLHLPLSAFRRQLDLIEAHCTVRPLAELLAEGPSGDRPNVAFTFDDAYRGAVEFALPELARRRLPTTLFVAPGLLGCSSFWWDELARPGEGLDAGSRTVALEREGGRHERIRAGQPAGAPARSLPRSYGCADETEVRALGGLEGLVLGAHTWSHPNLARLSADELQGELIRPLEWLRASSLPWIPVLAYPYGLSSAAVEVAVERAGYSAGLLVVGGWLDGGVCRPWAVPRYTVPAGLSDEGMLLRLSGTIAA